MNDMYREHILDHYQNPRNFGKLNNALHLSDFNPLCGDKAEIYARFKGDKVSDISFTASGCAISIASTSILTEQVKRMNKKEIMKLERKEMEKLIGIKVAPMRVKCMMLGLNILKRIIYESSQKSGISGTKKSDFEGDKSA